MQQCKLQLDSVKCLNSSFRNKIKSSASWFFTQPFCQAQVDENIKAPRHWPLWGELTSHWWIPRTKGQLCGKYFHLMTSSCILHTSITQTYVSGFKINYTGVRGDGNHSEWLMISNVFQKGDGTNYLRPVRWHMKRVTKWWSCQLTVIPITFVYMIKPYRVTYSVWPTAMIAYDLSIYSYIILYFSRPYSIIFCTPL